MSGLASSFFVKKLSCKENSWWGKRFPPLNPPSTVWSFARFGPCRSVTASVGVRSAKKKTASQRKRSQKYSEPSPFPSAGTTQIRSLRVSSQPLLGGAPLTAQK